MTSLAHDTTNDTRLPDFMGVVRAAGKDSLPNLAIAFARAIVDGVIDPAKDASGKDAAARVFEVYTPPRARRRCMIAPRPA